MIERPTEPKLNTETAESARVDYESATTNAYFEGWNDLELQGNPGIKDRIRKNIMQSEKSNEATYKKVAADLGISVEKLKARLQTKLEEMVAKSQFFRATHVDVLEKIMLVDGRWKSQFETTTSNGILNPSYRAATEVKMFGFNESEAGKLVDSNRYDWGGEVVAKDVLEKDKEKRPIYGYFSDEEHGAINHEGRIPPP